ALEDSGEASALKAIVGDRVPVTALKSQTGYLGAATAAVELGLGLLCAREALVPPIARHRDGHANSALDLVTGSARPLKQAAVGLFLSCSWGGEVAAIAARALQ